MKIRQQVPFKLSVITFVVQLRSDIAKKKLSRCIKLYSGFVLF